VYLFGDDEIRDELQHNHIRKCACDKDANTDGEFIINNSDRNLMHLCLLILFNTAWQRGYFPKVWKNENRIL